MTANMPNRSHSRDLRKGRTSSSGTVYHVRTSTLHRRRLFHDLWLGREVVRSLRFLHDRGDVESLAFVVMPDHLHWLFRLTGQRPLAGVMLSLKRASSQAINQRRNIRGEPVWQSGYFDRAMRREEDLRHVARYIVANPLRAGLCRSIGEYPLWDAIWL